MAVSRERQLVVTGGDDLKLKFWNYEDLSLIFEWNSFNSSITFR